MSETTDSTDLAVIQKPVFTCEVHPETINISVSASSRSEVDYGQHRLADWCVAKIAERKKSLAELQGAYELAKARKWKHTVLQSHANKARHRVIYYEKMLAAFRAGYILVPNFQMSIFAIRTDRQWPKKIISTNRRYSEKDQPAKLLPEGAGEYKNPSPSSDWYNVTTDAKGVSQDHYITGDWERLDFPMDMAKVEVMEAVDAAMAAKIFDEIGILPMRRTKGDPVIGGIIRMGGVSKWSAKTVTFILAWHVDTRTL